MSNDRHTKAPWGVVLPDRTRPSQIGVAGHNGQVTIYDAPLTDETEDNAYLIAGAPDALRILRHLMEYIEAGEPVIHFDGLMPDDGYDGATDEQTLAQAVKAYFAKIEGR